MSVNAPCASLPLENTVSRLLAGRAVRRPPQQEEAQRLQEAAMELLQQQQSVCALLREVENQAPAAPEHVSAAAARSLLVCELRHQAAQLGVPVAVLSVKAMLERLMEISGTDGDEQNRQLLTSSQRVQLGVLLESSRELLSQGVICPKLLWQEYRRHQRLLNLELVYHLHMNTFLSLRSMLESDEGSRLWLVSRLKALCGWTLPQDEEETVRVRDKVLSLLVGVLVGSGFEQSCEPVASDRRISLFCSSVLDEMLFWLLDTVDKSPTLEPSGAGAELWIRTYDASLRGAEAEAVRRFFTHCLTQTLTYRPRLTVSDAVTLQNEWTFAKTSRLLTSLFHQLSVVFSAEQLLLHLQQVLETHEVNWKHVLCFLSTLLVYNPCAQSSLNELLSRLLSSAFEGYDLEHMIMAFLCARQASLEGTSIFSSYTDWFKMSFGGSSSHHAGSKKSLVFLLKFLSDLVPFEPPQYLKVHILHPLYVPVKHRSLLMEYVSLAKTRLADLKESVEDMGLYEDPSGAGGSSLQPQCQAEQDVEKAVTLFDNTGRISATVMEASIFRKPYFLTRFLPSLLKARVLPVKADARMSLIEALKKADKIPAAQYSSYVESCQRQRQRQHNQNGVCLDSSDDPLDVLNVQLQDFRELLVNGDDGEVTPQLSRISHTLGVVFPRRPDEHVQQTVIKVDVETPMSSEMHVRAISMILRNFCQCLIDASRVNPPNKQSLWASRFVTMLLGNTQLLSGLVHRLWDLFQNQGSSLSTAHILGLAALVVHLHVSVCDAPLVQLSAPPLSKPLPVGEAVASALLCSTGADMVFCVRLCVAAVCYGMCRGDLLPQQQQQNYILSSLYKKLLYLIPRLLPEVRRIPVFSAALVAKRPEQNMSSLWSSTTNPNSSWRESARRLWRSDAFHLLHDTPEYQLPFCDWLENELQVQRHKDALSDPERQEYQQWACLELYWPRPEEHGGCGRDMKILCSRLLHSIMDHHLVEQMHDMGTCLPDIMSRLQECVCEMQVTSLSSSCSGPADMCYFLFEFVSQRCSSTQSLSVTTELSLQHTLHAWNRVLLTLPPQLLVQVKAEAGRLSLDCTKLIEHVNQHQRQVCSPAGCLSYHLTSHFLRGVLCASLCCTYPRDEVNKAWSQISLQCPLLLVSTVRWWECVSPVLVSQWRRVRGAEPLSEQLELLTDSQLWANSVASGSWLLSTPTPAAPALLLASSLHSAWRSRQGNSEDFRAALNKLRAESDTQLRQVLVSLFFLSVNEYVSALLYPQEKNHEHVRSFCSDVLCVLVDFSDWLLIFKSTEQGVYQSVTMVTSDEFTRLMPWAFYSLLLQQGEELLHRAVCCPGFLQTAVLCYVSLLQLFLEGPASSEGQSLSSTKSFLLRVIAQTPPAALSSGQLRWLQCQCADVDPEVAAALSVHVNVPSLSPEMDFL